jgi:hypothetical protein
MCMTSTLNFLDCCVSGMRKKMPNGRERRQIDKRKQISGIVEWYPLCLWFGLKAFEGRHIRIR